MKLPRWAKSLLPSWAQKEHDFSDVEELETEEGEPFVPNRRMRRAHVFGPDVRMKGPGYTRAMRKGRTQRVRWTPEESE